MKAGFSSQPFHSPSIPSPLGCTVRPCQPQAAAGPLSLGAPAPKSDATQPSTFMGSCKQCAFQILSTMREAQGGSKLINKPRELNLTQIHPLAGF